MILNTPEGKLRAFNHFKEVVDANIPEWIPQAHKPMDFHFAYRLVTDTTNWHVPGEYESEAIHYLITEFNKQFNKQIKTIVV